MGAAASFDSAASWSEKGVAERVTGLGKAFGGYGQSIEENALNLGGSRGILPDGTCGWKSVGFQRF